MSKMKFLLILLIFILVFIFFTLLFLLPKCIFEIYAQNQLYSKSNIEFRPVAIVFGAGLLRDGTPTKVLEDRVVTATELYLNGKVKKLLFSGDNRFSDYNEPGAMKTLALSLGVPEQDIILDYAGRRTYDTCYRALHIFNVNDAILVTQKYHQPRALFTCNKLGLNAIGIPADQRDYHKYSYQYWSLREVFASFMAVIDIYITHPTPVLGDPEPIELY